MISGNSSSGSTKNLVKTIRMDFTVKRGDYFSYVYDVDTIDANGNEAVVNLTGYYAQMQLKKKKTDAHYFTAMAVNIDTAASTITFFKSSEDMQITAGTYWYDLEIKDSNSRSVTWIEGKFKIIQDVTEWIDQIEIDIFNVFKSAVDFVRGFGVKYPIALRYYQSFWNNRNTDLAVDYVNKLWKKYVVGLKSVYSFIVGSNLMYPVVFTLSKTFAVMSVYMKMTNIIFLQTLSIFTNKAYYFKVSFGSSYNFEFTQVIASVVEFYETYRFWTEADGYTEQTES